MGALFHQSQEAGEPPAQGLAHGPGRFLGEAATKHDLGQLQPPGSLSKAFVGLAQPLALGFAMVHLRQRRGTVGLGFGFDGRQRAPHQGC